MVVAEGQGKSKDVREEFKHLIDASCTVREEGREVTGF